MKCEKRGTADAHPRRRSGAQRAPRCPRSVGAGVLDGPVERIVPHSRCVADAAPYDDGRERILRCPFGFAQGKAE